MLPRALGNFFRGLGKGGRGSGLKSASELDPQLLAKARKLALGVGTAAGAFGSLVGVGGGVLIGPVILNACPAVPQRVISGTSLAAVATTGATAGAVYWSSDCVQMRSALLLAATAVLTAPMGARMTHRFDCQRLRQALGWWLYIVAPLVPLKSAIFSGQQQQQQQQQQEAPGAEPALPAAAVAAAAAKEQPRGLVNSSSNSSSSSSSSSKQNLLQELLQPPTAASAASDLALAATGSLAGFASGLLGIGGGTVVTPLLALATGAPQQVVLGTSLVAMVVPSLVGLAQHTRLGNVDWRMAAMLAAGTSVGSYVGSRCAIEAPAGALEAAFCCGMLLLGRRTLAAAAKAVPKAAQ